MKKIGLIDLGSNTIKLAVYQRSQTGWEQIFYDSSYAYVIRFVKDDLLTQEGIEKIISTLQTYQVTATSMGCEELQCFSTASLRNIHNQAEVIAQVKKASGITILPISGKDEAYYNFLSMSKVAGDTFLGGDMGGGSMQLFVGEKKKLQKHHSFPLGALKIYGQFVSGSFPTPAEAEAISSFVTTSLSEEGFLPQHGTETLYFMGGSTRVICAILKATNGRFSKQELETLLARYLSDPALAETQIKKICPERLQTVLPGMIILNSVCDYFQIRQIVYTSNSVREGYLLHHFSERTETSS